MNEPKVKCIECAYCITDIKKNCDLCSVMVGEEPVVIPTNQIGCDNGFPLIDAYPEDEYYEQLLNKIC